jgi:hypothetical protein
MELEEQATKEIHKNCSSSHPEEPQDLTDQVLHKISNHTTQPSPTHIRR